MLVAAGLWSSLECSELCSEAFAEWKLESDLDSSATQETADVVVDAAAVFVAIAILAPVGDAVAVAVPVDAVAAAAVFADDGVALVESVGVFLIVDAG